MACCFSSGRSAPRPFLHASADPALIAPGRRLLDYLYSLPAKSSAKVLSGQYHINDSNTVFSETGYRPAISGEHVINGESSSFAAVGKSLITSCISWWNSGGVVLDGCKIHNLITRGLMTSGTCSDAQMAQIMTEGHPYNTNFKEWFDAYAGAMKQFEAAGVPVIIRPLHECNNGAFWYRYPSASVLKTFFQYIYNYLVNVKGCHNLLFCYAPSAYRKNATTYYPGGAYVDIVGVDSYPDLRTAAMHASYFTDYAPLVATGKPFALTEFGPKPGSGSASDTSDGRYDRAIAGIKSILPNTVFWYSWSVGWSMKRAYNGGSSANVITCLSDPWVVNRDDLPDFRG